ncbi:MAG: hypothetical protein ABEI86_10000 [Halobacteriaceae archaeon]
MSKSPAHGLLTERERDFLKGDENDISNPRKVRRQIRQRVESALSDLALVHEKLEERDIRQVGTESEEGFVNSFREDYFGTLGLLYRLADENGIDVESMLWEGLYSVHTQAHPDEVAEIDLAITTEPRKDVSERVRKKTNQNRPLTDLELRTLFVNQPELDETLREAVKQSPGNDIRTLESIIREDVTRIEEGLTIIDDDLPVSDTPYPKPDILARDEDGNVVLIEIAAEKDIPREIPDFKDMADQLTDLAEEYGDPAQVRTILAVPYAESISEKAKKSTTLEFKSIFDGQSEIEDLIS